MVGSVEFAETYEQILTSQALAYINLDTAVTGHDFFQISASPSFSSLMERITKQVTIEKTNLTVYDLWKPTELEILGSGSDQTAFLCHLGISSMDMRFDSENDEYTSVYHSNYDSFYWFERFGDPLFTFHAATAKVYGGVAISFAEEKTVPLNATDFANGLQQYIASIASVSSQVNWGPLFTSASLFSDAAAEIESERALQDSLSP